MNWTRTGAKWRKWKKKSFIAKIFKKLKVYIFNRNTLKNLVKEQDDKMVRLEEKHKNKLDKLDKLESDNEALTKLVEIRAKEWEDKW
jgi:3-methyladenine DNA glycosylase/8-oxoguanine DNA glycosylase